MNTENAIPVVRHESREAAAYSQALDNVLFGLVPTITPHVAVGAFRPCLQGTVGGAQSYEYGIPVAAYTADGHCVYHAVAWGHNVYDPQRRNKIGGLGAYVPTRPTDAEVQTLIDGAVHALEQHTQATSR